MKKFDVSKEQLIKNIHAYVDENGKSPSYKEIKNPGCMVYYRVFETQKWNEILSIANVNLNHVNGYDEKELIEKLIGYYNFLGKIPTKEDFKKYNFSPGHELYNRYFGSYEKALDIAGIKKYIPFEEREENSKKLIYELGQLYNKFPTVDLYDSMAKERNAISRRELERRFGKRYNEICREILPDMKANILHNEYKKEDIINDIINCIKFYSPIVPIYREYLNWSNNNYTYTTISKFCGKSYLEIIKELGYKPRGTTTKKRSKEQMIEEFVALYKELERIPTSDEINECKYCASAPTYTDTFGSIEDICIACDIEYIPNENNGFGYIVKDKNGEYCKSFAEMEITNYFIDNNIQYEKEYNYNKIKNFDDKDKRRLDWKIIYKEKIFYIEYFGCYTNTKNSNMYRTYVKKADNKVKDFLDKNMADDCIFIYPSDYHTKELCKIFEPYFERIV